MTSEQYARALNALVDAQDSQAPCKPIEIRILTPDNCVQVITPGSPCMVIVSDTAGTQHMFADWQAVKP